MHRSIHRHRRRRAGLICAGALAILVSGPALSASDQGDLQGRVTWMGERQLRSLWVKVVPEGRGEPVTKTFEGPQGVFRFQALPAGRYTVLLRATMQRGMLIGRADDVEVSADQATIEVPIFQGLRLQGQVLDVDGSPAAYARVHLRDERLNWFFGELSDAAGRFVFEGVEPRLWTLQVEDDGGNGYVRHHLTVDTQKVLIQKRPFQEFRGSVRVDGRSASGARVEILDLPERVGGETDQEGRFHLRGLGERGADGTVQAQVVFEGIPFLYRFTNYDDGAVHLGLETGWVDATVVDDAGDPVTGLALDFVTTPDAPAYSKSSHAVGADGRLRARVPRGSHEVNGLNGTHRVLATEVATSSSAGAATQKLRAFRNRAVRLRVLRPDGSPARRRIRISTRGLIGGQSGEWVDVHGFDAVDPDAQGELLLPTAALVNHDALIFLQSPEGVVAPLEVPATADSTDPIEVRLVGGGSLQIAVPEGRSVVPRTVVLYHAAAGDRPSGLYAQNAMWRDGRATAERLAPGTWLVQWWEEAEVGKATEEEMRVEIRDGETTNVQFGGGG